MTSPDRVVLHAPLSGWMSALAEVPDEVFGQGMMGEGLAIDPLDATLLAPCDGTIVQLAPTAHALTLRASNGAEILLHIGLETVALGGRGFQAQVAAGQVVRQGDPLIAFDLDAVARSAKSLITPMVITNSEAFEFTPSPVGRSVAQGEPVASVEPRGAQPAPSTAREDEARSAFVIVGLEHGIHARPAARIAACAKSYDANVTLRAHGKEVSARSPVSLMTAAVQAGDKVEIVASGREAEAAIAAVVGLLGSEPTGTVPEPAPAKAVKSTDAPAAGEFTGVCAVPGLAIGPAFQLRVSDPEVAERGGDVALEQESLTGALAAVARSLTSLARSGDPTRAAIAAAHLELLEDEALVGAARAEIDRGKSAAFGWRTATRSFAQELRSSGSPLLRERADDLLDLERQVISANQGVDTSQPPSFPAGAILLAEDLLPSQLMRLSESGIAGICTAGGGPTSHVAIMAAASGIPTLVAAGAGVTAIADGATVLLDATAGHLSINPSLAVSQAAAQQAETLRQRRERQQADAAEACRTADGTRIEVFANLGSTAEAAEAVAAGAEGCGLLRSEFLFLDRADAPGEDEQLAAYQKIANALGGRPLIVRTLDVGGDKPLPYLPIPHEDNPALGLRGVRTSLWKPDLLDEQLRAILRVRPAGICKIMVPMVVSLDELREVRARLDAAAASVGSSSTIELGVMIETPAAAMLADQLAEEADFFSFGSNDLTQYALAMDRTNPLVAARVDAFHPAVLRLIATAARAGAARGRPVGMCGGLASDPLGAVLLIGLGVTELSVPSGAIPALKAQVRSVTVDQCRAIGERALEQTSPHAVKKLVADALARNSTDGANS